jgi:hypothetical protein
MIRRPSVSEGTTFYNTDLDCYVIYVFGRWQSVPERAIVDIVRAHQWSFKAKRCMCGWRADRLNHPAHVTHMLETRSMVYPPLIEFSSEWGPEFSWKKPLRFR